MNTNLKLSFPVRIARSLFVVAVLLALLQVSPVHAATLMVINVNDSGIGSLRWAIANASPGDTITFRAALAGKTISLSATLKISKNVTINGSTLSSPVKISGNHAVRVFMVDSGVTATLRGLNIIDGKAVDDGGGILNNGSLTVLNSNLIGNHANSGGAIATYNMLIVRDSTFSGNVAISFGGGIENVGAMEVSGSTFIQNSGKPGAGISSLGQPGATTVINSTFSKNNGEGIYTLGSLEVINSTFSENNSSALAGGIYLDEGTLNLRNTILANSIGGPDCYKGDPMSVLQSTNNLIETNASGTNACGTPSISADPKLGTLGNYGGLTETIPLLPDSPAIDAGDDSICPVTDQRGLARPQRLHCDIGAYEARAIQVLELTSNGSQDGWILESLENGNAGMTMNVATTTLRLGDDAMRRQYRSILSFGTSSLPDTSVITKVTLKIKRQNVTGGEDPISLFQGFVLDIKKGIFGSAVLQATDWQATANKPFGPYTPTLGSGWYTFDLTGAKGYFNKLATGGGLTQIRLRFQLDDNNNAIANYLSLYSGNADAASRPQLIIEYYMP